MVKLDGMSHPTIPEEQNDPEDRDEDFSMSDEDDKTADTSDYQRDFNPFKDFTLARAV